MIRSDASNKRSHQGHSLPTAANLPNARAKGKPVILWHAWIGFSEAEIRFLNDLDWAIDARGMRLVLSVPEQPPAGALTCETFVFPPGPFDVSALAHTANKPGTIAARTGNLEALIACDKAWDSQPVPPELESLRIQGLDALASIFSQLLLLLEPSLIVLWNGHHSGERILFNLAGTLNIPVYFTERGPFVRTLFADPSGIVSDSAFLADITQSACRTSSKRWLRIWDRFAKRRSKMLDTWWTQPKELGAAVWKKRLQIPEDALVLLFVGQVDQDAQSFRFAPHFSSNLEAFETFCRLLPRDRPLFILGKHHPKSKSLPSDYQKVVRGEGVWTDDLSLTDALALADRVAAVNSSVLFEAMIAGKPLLAMGQWLGRGSGAAYEDQEAAPSQSIIENWLLDSNAAERRRQQRRLGSELLRRGLFALDASFDPDLRTHDALARIFVQAARSRQGPLKKLGCTVTDIDDLSRQWRRSRELCETIREQSSKILALENERCASQLWIASIQGRDRELWIWGAGEGGRAVAAKLAQIGCVVAGFVTSLEDHAPCIDGLPVRSWRSFEPGKERFVLVVSSFVEQIVPLLDNAQLKRGTDCDIMDPGVAARLWGPLPL